MHALIRIRACISCSLSGRISGRRRPTGLVRVRIRVGQVARLAARLREGRGRELVTMRLRLSSGAAVDLRSRNAIWRPDRLVVADRLPDTVSLSPAFLRAFGSFGAPAYFYTEYKVPLKPLNNTSVHSNQNRILHDQ